MKRKKRISAAELEELMLDNISALKSGKQSVGETNSISNGVGKICTIVRTELSVARMSGVKPTSGSKKFAEITK